jgi:hypothetical protein
MDCEVFDKLVVDRVFSELDDLSSGAVQRHVAHCSRCRSIESGLRATREVATLPLIEPPSSFVERVLTIERATRTQLPLRQRMGRTVSVLAGYAMRPQLSMTALLLLMIGSSLILLRSHPAERELVQVTERGVPEGDVDGNTDSNHKAPQSVLQPAVSNLAPEVVAPKLDVAPQTENGPVSNLLELARKAYAEERYDEAHELAEQVIVRGGTETANAALLSALALSKRSGCGAALARFEALRVRYGRTSLGEEASFRAAECHIETAQYDRARKLLEQLRTSTTWGARARSKLNALAELPHTSAESADAGIAAPPSP